MVIYLQVNTLILLGLNIGQDWFNETSHTHT